MRKYLTDRSRISRSFALLGTAQVALIAAITLIVVPLPAIQREFDLSRPDLALLSAAYGLSFGGLLLVGGRLADKFGARRVFLIGVAVFGGSSLCGGLAMSHETLLAARFAQGVGAALVAPAALAIVAHLHPPGPQRSRAYAIWGTLSVTGAVSGSVLSGFLAATSSWRPAVLVPAAVAAAVLAGHRRLPTIPARPAVRLALVDGLLITTGLVSFSWGILQVIPALVVLGALLVTGFFFRQARSRRPLLPLALVTQPGRAAALLTIWLVAGVSATTTFLLSLYLQQIQQLSPIQTSLVFLPFLLVITTGPVSARLLPRYGAGVVTGCGLGLAAAGMLLLTRLSADSANLGGLLTALVLFTVGSGLAFSGATVAALDRVPTEHSGVAGGVTNTALEVGPTVGLALLLTIAAARTDAVTAAGAASAHAVTAGYRAAFGVAALAFLLLTPIVLYTRTKEVTQ